MPKGHYPRKSGFTKTPQVKRPVIFPIGPSTAYVPLTQGQFALIDADDIPIVEGFNWIAHWSPCVRGFYAKRYKSGGGMVAMHREICSPEGLQVDHKDCDRTLDNRKNNLRAADSSQQKANRRIQSNNKSGYKGVHYHAQSGKWRAQTRKAGKSIHIGVYISAAEAHEAYFAKAKEIFGGFANRG